MLKRCHNSSSVARSIRGSAFHSSSSTRNRLTPPRQSLPAASFSASATIASLAALVCSFWAARSALRASCAAANWGVSASSLVTSPSRSPTALASPIEVFRWLMDFRASSGDNEPDSIRCDSRFTSVSSDSKRRTKKASASDSSASGT